MAVKEFTILGTKFSVQSHTYELTALEAALDCASLGEGWRLPTLLEARLFGYLSQLGVGGRSPLSGQHRYTWTITPVEERDPIMSSRALKPHVGEKKFYWTVRYSRDEVEQTPFAIGERLTYIKVRTEEKKHHKDEASL